MIAGIFRNEANEKVYTAPYFPIGTVYTSVTNVNPTIYFGGTWEAFAKGRTLIGVDTSDTDFSNVKKTGGSKTHTHTQGATGKASGNTGSTALTIDQMPGHNHGIYSNTDYRSSSGVGYWGWGLIEGYCYGDEKNVNNGGGTRDVGGGQGHTHTLNSHTHTNPNTESSSNVQPYITVYFWVRTA